MVKIYEFGNISLTIGGEEYQYSNSTTLDESIEKNFKVIKQETDNLDTNETHYSLMQGQKQLAFIKGYYKSPTNFHIRRIENTTGDKISGVKYLSQIYKTVEDDLRKNGVESITTLSVAKLAHIAVKRYGFYDTHGRSYEDLKNNWLKFIPWKAVSLEKQL